MTTSELNKLVNQCKNIENRIKSVSDDENEEDFFNSMVDSKYYKITDFNKMKPDKSSSLGLMHVNIASLDAHIDDLRMALGRLKFSFDVIGISEHKIRENSQPSNNIDLTDYEKFEYQPTGTSHGGTGFYVKSDLDFKVRDDLNLNSPGNFEAMFNEILLLVEKI